MASLTSDRAFSRYSLFPILSENGSIANCLLKAAGLGYRWGHRAMCWSQIPKISMMWLDAADRSSATTEKLT